MYTIDKKQVDLMTPDELWEEFKWLRESGIIMYEVFDKLNEIFKSYCHNDGKEWNNAEKENVKRFLFDPFNPLSISEVVIRTGRTPFSVYNTFVRLMWNAVYSEKKGLLKRILKSAVRYKYAQWSN